MVERLREGAHVQLERRYVRKDGSHAWVSLTSVPLANVAGTEPQHLAMIADITQRKHAEEQLVASERMAALGMLAAGVAHEINNPLAAAMANIELAMGEVATLGAPSSQELGMHLSEAHECAARVRTIVRDLKVFARSGDEALGPVDIRRVLDSTLRMVSNEVRQRARLIRTDGDDVPLVHANESRLGQVFVNLVVNAAQSIPPGAALDNEVRVTTRVAADGHLAVEIADTGTGMSPETRTRLFTPFFTTKAAGLGTGLGLAICRRIVSDLGGRIEVTSEVGVGSTFTVYLVASEQVVEASAAVAAPASPSCKRGRVLVVDDEKVLADVLGRMVSREHDVTAVHSGREALDLITAGERYDVVLCDLMMAEVSGVDVYNAVADLAPDQAERFIFMTGGAFAPVAQEFLERVGNPRLEKPFDREVLLGLVNERVGHAANGRAPGT
jgi:signal transduction histidine kinase/ActR/RegA family two-component response regulator